MDMEITKLKESLSPKEKDKLEEELADQIIKIHVIADKYQIDVEQAVRNKFDNILNKIIL